MRQLILFRHAKTEPFSETGTDESRRLTEQGQADADLVGARLTEFGVQPDCVIISTARRTRETWMKLQTYFPNARAIYREGLYLADTDELAAEISKQPDCGVMLVIGHNDGLHEFAMQLCAYGGAKNNEAHRQLRIKFPPGGVALFEAKEDDPFNVYNFELTEFITPKSLRPDEVPA